MTNSLIFEILFFYFSFQACKDKRICFNTPMPKAELGCSNTFTTREDQIESSGKTRSLNTEEEEKEDCNDDILTPGNLMAFAWHVCQGMVSRTAVISSSIFVTYLKKQSFIEEKPPYFASWGVA